MASERLLCHQPFDSPLMATLTACHIGYMAKEYPSQVPVGTEVGQSHRYKFDVGLSGYRSLAGTANLR